MKDKAEFMAKCRELGIAKKNAELGWEKINHLKKYLDEHCDTCERLKNASKEDKLRLRQFAAEQGIEYTPDELDEIIRHMNLIKDNM